MSAPPQATKKVTLKLKISDSMADETDRSRAATSNDSTTAPASVPAPPAPPQQRNPRKSTTPGPNATTSTRRRRRGRPRKASLVAAAAAAARENGQLQDDGDGDVTLGFRFLSDHSFPLLVDTTSGAVVGAPGPEPGSDRARRCACCGVPGSVPAEPPPHGQSPWRYPGVRAVRREDVGAHTRRGLVVRRGGERPNTLGFWYDLTVGEMMLRSRDLDLKMLGLRMIWDRAGGDFGELEGMVRIVGDEGFGRGYWNLLVDEVVGKGKTWRRNRRWKVTETKVTAEFAAWEERVRCEEFGGFVADTHGAWVLRTPGLDGAVRRVLRLGYKRGGWVDDVRESWDESLDGRDLAKYGSEEVVQRIQNGESLVVENVEETDERKIVVGSDGNGVDGMADKMQLDR